MKRLLVLLALLALPAFAGDTNTTRTQPAPTEPATMRFADAAGTWVGEVTEKGVKETYTITLTLRETGAGEVHYFGAGYDCRGVLAPVSEGARLELVETITIARDQCSDGRVFIALYGDEMEWRWGLSMDELYAAATLTRAK